MGKGIAGINAGMIPALRTSTVQRGRFLRANASSKHTKGYSGGVEVREEHWQRQQRPGLWESHERVTSKPRPEEEQ